MNTTDLPPQIRECVDSGAKPISFCEIRARAVLTEPAVRRAPVRRGTRVAVTGVVAAGIAGALVASQLGGEGGGATAVLTAAVINHMASASQAAMTSGEAHIAWTSGSSPNAVQDVTFDGSNWNDVLNPGAPTKITDGPNGSITRTGESINRVVDGHAYHFPAFVFTPGGPQFESRWALIGGADAARQLNFPDPRSLLSVLSQSAGFVSDGSGPVGGVQVRHLHATTPGAVPASPLDPIIASEPDNARLSALDLWVDSAGVVLKARLTLTGSSSSSVTVTVTFSKIGQPQPITVPPITVPPNPVHR